MLSGNGAPRPPTRHQGYEQSSPQCPHQQHELTLEMTEAAPLEAWLPEQSSRRNGSHLSPPEWRLADQKWCSTAEVYEGLEYQRQQEKTASKISKVGQPEWNIQQHQVYQIPEIQPDRQPKSLIRHVAEGLVNTCGVEPTSHHSIHISHKPCDMTAE